MPPQPELLIGAHTSAAGGVANALLEGREIGATTIQLFTNNQRRWESKVISEEEIARWQEALALTGIQKVMSHDSYLINLGANNEEILHKSRAAFKREIERCHALDIAYLNFHPGAACGDPIEECLDRIVASLLECEALASKGKTMLLLEATAGQGTTAGSRFEELGYVIEHTHKKIPIGVCIDTCHIFAAGYDIRTAEGWEETLADFDRHVGLDYLQAFHLNDSMKGLGSRRDRHAPLGKGEIGMECFRFLMHDKRTRKLPKYLETPDGPPLWKKEIAMLRTFT